ncbi:hypothetical protein ASPTUDRAFT_39405 [Aspergillus tubingensis CBS 134.48]|uniref:Uncharacterized protein n=1 Tax=Aspergillus tubingensis (strain CBS 134.48) TaxID=767770 RepID=A0A1L9NB61_ASPTC|nr:hypothetical protein ASPTUDRAFT_39405 [Aspergillus tubingensis CBS 134.48]
MYLSRPSVRPSARASPSSISLSLSIYQSRISSSAEEKEKKKEKGKDSKHKKERKKRKKKTLTGRHGTSLSGESSTQKKLSIEKKSPSSVRTVIGKKRKKKK